MTCPGSQGRNGASCGGGTQAQCASERPLPTRPWDWALASWRPWLPRHPLGAALGQLALQGATHHPALTLAGLALASAALTVWPGVALTSPHGQGSPSVPIGSPRTNRLAVPLRSRPVGRPRASTGPTAPGLCFGPTPRVGRLHRPSARTLQPKSRPPPAQSPGSVRPAPGTCLPAPRARSVLPPGRCELPPEPQVTPPPRKV